MFSISLFFLRSIAVALLSISLYSSQAFAQDSSELTSNYVVSVHGIVCELCSYGVAKKIRKLSFVDKTKYKKGVKVDINNQLVYVAVREDQSLDKSALFKAIEAGGYQPVTLWAIDVDGEQREVLE